MQYNIHPIFVHFPIALLTLYSIIKIIPLRRWFTQIELEWTGRILLFFGLLGAFASLSTGELAEHLTRPNHQLVEIHSFFANLSTWIYGLILLGEILYIVDGYLVKYIRNATAIKYIKIIENILTRNWIVITLSILGLVSLTLTGLFGGAIVYGTTADPFADTILRLFGIN